MSLTLARVIELFYILSRSISPLLPPTHGWGVVSVVVTSGFPGPPRLLSLRHTRVKTKYGGDPRDPEKNLLRCFVSVVVRGE